MHWLDRIFLLPAAGLFWLVGCDGPTIAPVTDLPSSAPRKTFRVGMDQSRAKRMYILSVGVTEYRDPLLTQPMYSDADAKAFAELWGQVVPKENIYLVTNRQATRDRIRRAIRDDLGKAAPEDTVLVFFSGHGAQEEVGKDKAISGLLLHDSDRATPDTWYQMSQLTADLKQYVAARNLLLLLDACHSGAAVLVRAPRRTRSPKDIDKALLKDASLVTVRQKQYNWSVFTSCRSEEKARSAHETRHGWFTYWLLRGLVGYADSRREGGDADGRVTFKELERFVYDHVTKSTGGFQTPVCSGRFHTESVMSHVVEALPQQLQDDTGRDLAVLEVRVTPKDARVYFDGSRLQTEQGKIFALPAGQHRMRVARSGHKTEEGPVTLPAGQKAILKVKLKREMEEQWH